jgi:hypothetical protein
MEVEEAQVEAPVPVSSKKSSKKAKKLTIQTGTAEKEKLLSEAAAAAVVETTITEVVNETAVVTPSTEAYATPSKSSKKDKKGAKSVTKSLLKSQSKYGHEDEDLMTSADRRVSFSQPLSMIKYISPLTKDKKTLFLGIPAGANIEQDEENVRQSASKKRLWAEDA